MIRLALLFSGLTALLAAPVAAQTALSDRPGLWISVPRADAPVVEAPAVNDVVLEAPDAGPLITGTPAPGVMLTPPEPALIAAPPPPPETRPVPRPREIVAVADVVVVPDVAVVAPVSVEPPVATAPQDTPDAADPSDPAAAIEVAAAPPAPVVSTFEAGPLPRPETEATVALAEALAAQIATEAHAIMAAAPRAVPLTEGIAPSEALAPVVPSAQPPVQPRATPEAADREPAPVRVLSPPSVVPVLTVAFAPAARAETPVPMSAVLLPSAATATRPLVQPVAFITPPLETAPILPRLHPSGPVALEAVPHLALVRSASLSAVLLPSVSVQSAPVPPLARAALPARDLFPMSALPPSALPEGPESLARTIQPPHPFAEANAAVLTGLPPVVPVRMPALLPSEAPAFDTPVTDPDAAVDLPAPDPGAVARMMDDAMICWRMAGLGSEAQWARLSVDVALDETNMPSAESIRLTGFARVVSGAAEEAYRAAHAALMGCAEATGNAPATSSSTLVFDRSGVRLQ